MTNDIVAQLRSSDFCSCEIIYRAADRIETLESVLENIIIYSDDVTVVKAARAALEGKDE
jgi:hypothetical protein